MKKTRGRHRADPKPLPRPPKMPLEPGQLIDLAVLLWEIFKWLLALAGGPVP